MQPVQIKVRVILIWPAFLIFKFLIVVKDIMPLSETGSDDENTSEDSEVGIKKAPTVTKRRPSDASILSSEEEPAPPRNCRYLKSFSSTF